MRTEAILRDEQPVFVGEGGARQEGSLKLYRCTTCGAEVVWATSRRTGRKYLCNVYRGRSDARFYQKNAIHKECEQQVAERERLAEVERLTAEYLTEQRAVTARVKAGLLERGSSEFEDEMDRLDHMVDRIEDLKVA